MQASENHAAVTRIRAPLRERGLRRMTISTSRSSAVRNHTKGNLSGNPTNQELIQVEGLFRRERCFLSWVMDPNSKQP
jgi:hypothetical protein